MDKPEQKMRRPGTARETKPLLSRFCNIFYGSTGRCLAAIALSLCMVFSLYPASASASEKEVTDGLNEKCGHVHREEDCGFQEEVGGAACAHMNEDGTYSCVPNSEDSEADSSYVCGHGDDCGYVEAAEGVPCTHSCKLCSQAETIEVMQTEQDADISGTAESMEQDLQEDPNVGLTSCAAEIPRLRAGLTQPLDEGVSVESGNTYTISNGAQLKYLKTIVNGGNNCSGAVFQLTGDIQLTDDWIPIGMSSAPFSGTFDGQRHIISGLSINTSSRYCGLFGYVNNAVIKDLGIENASVTSTGNDAAILAGFASGSTIERCYVTGNVKAYAAVSGLVGSTYSGITTIRNCYVRVALSPQGGRGDTAGISGWNESSSIEILNCYSACIGELRPIAGWSDGSAVPNGKITNTYFDKSLSPDFSPSSGRADLGRTSEELKQQSTYDGWDFSGIWAIDSGVNGGYPYLRGFIPGLFGAPGSISVTIKGVDGSPITDANVAIKLSNDGSSPEIPLSHQGGGLYSGTVTTENGSYDLYVSGAKVDGVTIVQSGKNAVDKGEITVSLTPPTPAVEVKWGADKNSLTNSGTFADAMSSSAAYIQLQSDVNPSSSPNVTWELTLDLNGSTITLPEPLTVTGSGAHLTVQDTSAGTDGKLTYAGINKFTVSLTVDAQFTLKHGIVEHTNGASVINSKSSGSDGGKITIEGGTVQCEMGSAADGGSNAIYSMGGFLMTGGEVISSCGTPSIAVAGDTGRLENGTVNNTGGSSAWLVASETEIAGGTLSGSGADSNCYAVKNFGTLKLSGSPVLSGQAADIYTQGGATVSANIGGTFYSGTPVSMFYKAEDQTAGDVLVNGLEDSSQAEKFSVINLYSRLGAEYEDLNKNLVLIEVPVPAPEVDAVNKYIYAGGLEIQIVAGSMAGCTNILYDKDGDGIIGMDEYLKISSAEPSAGGYDLSGYHVFGGSLNDAVTGSTKIIMRGGKVNGICGGGRQSGSSVQNTNVTITGGTVTGQVYGGSAFGTVDGTVTLTVGGSARIGLNNSGIVINGGSVTNGVDSFAVYPVLEADADVKVELPSGFAAGSVFATGAVRSDIAKVSLVGSGAVRMKPVLSGADIAALRQEDTPTATFAATGADSGLLKNVTSGMEYSIDQGGSWTDIIGSTVTVQDGVTPTNDVWIVKKGNGTTTDDSEVQTIDITQGAAVSGVTAIGCTTGGNDDGQLAGITTAMEYRLSTSDSWIEGTGSTVTGLANGLYYVRITASGTMLAGDTSSFTVMEYIPAPVYSIGLSQSGTYIFTETVAGYGVQNPLAVTVQNTGNRDTGALSVILSGTNADAFVIEETDIRNVAAGGKDSFKVSPAMGLVPGIYTAVVTVSGGNAIAPQSFAVSFTVNAGPPAVTGVTVSPSSITVTKGATLQFLASVQGTNDPVQTVTWSVSGNQKAGTAISESGLLTVAPDETAVALTITATSVADAGKAGSAAVTVASKPAAAPKIIEGINQSVEQGEDAVFKSDAEFEDFQKVLLDGKEISPGNYTVKEGSTVVILSSSYIKTLSEGRHTIGIVSKNGTAKTTFTIVKAESRSEMKTAKPASAAPRTGDHSGLFRWFAVLFLSGGLSAAMILRKKRKIN
ncbi:hypothetical protein LQE92_05370 [Lacrimispora sp. NSJ-141]|uniref:Ig-like domain-containing protein n=1 Tax=Lientehia hominis TaxID=2897778 RepID=A0AAP2W9R8_9FIRM|nr:hypothetical protein [Lientehia hominis]MCD2492054.1 hypothetical protein [Lientehia hominis]